MGEMQNVAVAGAELSASRAKIHFVCTGNICRSPFAAFYLQSKLGSPKDTIELSSSGIFVLESRPPSKAMSDFIRSICLADPDDHSSRQTKYSKLGEFDLILTMTSDQRSILMEESPKNFQKIFTLREFALIIKKNFPEHYPSENEALLASKRTSSKAFINGLTAFAAAKRTSIATTGLDLDVIDPYRKSDEVYHQAIDQMVPALDVIAEQLNSQTH